jgi:hypothetical protein
VKRFAGFIGATIAVVCLGAWIITRAMPGHEIARSVRASAIAVVIVQAATFSIAWMMRPVNVIAGWGMGMVIRLITLVLFGMFGVKAFGLALQPALLSMAGFFFVSTLIEPVFLKP